MIIAESGLASLSLREVARRTGVMHQAPYRHFPTRVDLLVAIALEGYALLGEQQAGPLPEPADMHRDEVMAPAQEMAVSRSSLREAVRRLEQSGLLIIVPNRGVFVRRVGLHEVLDLFDVHAGLARTAGRLLAVRISAPQAAQLEARHAAMQDAQQAGEIERCRTLNERARGPRLLWEIGAWLAAGRGVLSFSPAHVGAFIRSRPEIDAPDLQVVFTPASYSDGVTGQPQPFPGMTFGVWQMRPHSRGWVRARSADPDEPPAIQPNYLAEEADRRAAVDSLRWARRLLDSAALAPYRDVETTPGPVASS